MFKSLRIGTYYNLKRHYIGIEINPEYVAIGYKQLQNFTPSLFE